MGDLRADRDRLRNALAALVGVPVDNKEALEQMEMFLRVAPAPIEDKAAAIDAIHALLASIEEN